MDVSLTTSPSQASTPNRTSGLSGDFETFLKMLTVQMRNQDPLNPIEASDYAVQLATFSNVEQSVKTNQLLESIQQQFGMFNLSQAANWIGQEARSAAPVYYAGSPVEIVTEPARTADRAVLVVRDMSDQVVSREDLPLTASSHVWTGEDMTGMRLPDARYALSLESYTGDTLIGSTPVEHYALVHEVRGGASGTRVILAGGVEVDTADITALRRP